MREFELEWHWVVVGTLFLASLGLKAVWVMIAVDKYLEMRRRRRR